MENFNIPNLYNILEILEKNLDNINENDYNEICIELKKINFYINELNNEKIEAIKELENFIKIISNFNKINLKLIKELNKNNETIL